MDIAGLLLLCLALHAKARDHGTCAAHRNCTSLRGNCCPTPGGVTLGCCSTDHDHFHEVQLAHLRAPKYAMGAYQGPDCRSRAHDYGKSSVGYRLGNGQCSELARLAAAEVGAILPAAPAPGRWAWGREISEAEAQPGDFMQMWNTCWNWPQGGQSCTPMHTAMLDRRIGKGSWAVLEQNPEPVHKSDFYDLSTMSGEWYFYTLDCTRDPETDTSKMDSGLVQYLACLPGWARTGITLAANQNQQQSYSYSSSNGVVTIRLSWGNGGQYNGDVSACAS